MNLDKFFKPHSRPAEEARAMRPHEIESAQIHTEAAIRANLGGEKIDGGNSGAFADKDDFVGQAAANWERLRELSSGKEYRQLEDEIGEKVKEQFAAAKANIETAPVEWKQAVRDIEHSLSTQEELGWNPSVLTALMNYERPDLHHLYEPTRTVAIFTPEIQEAIANFYKEQQVRESESKILSARADEFNRLSKEEAA